MIPRTEPRWQTETWQQSLQNVVRDVHELCQLVEINPNQLPISELAQQQFSFKVPRSFVARMEKGNPTDPLLLQVLPQIAETVEQLGFVQDPLAERNSNPVPGLIHKYHGRVLLIISGGCAINCRYCFRRHFPYKENNPSREQWQQAINYIAADTSITEVIFSGGDPLVATDKQLEELIQQLAQISHLKRLRIHTRLPIVIPSRITERFIDCLTQTRLEPVIVLHSNHARELSDEVALAMQALRQKGIVLLNQSVLLAGINDTLDAQKALSERLFSVGILPYYLHVLDKIDGGAHFDSSETSALSLIESLRHCLPGYLVPKLVREEADMKSKTPLY
jgi:EF-P beta-lysylation protein EpmB